MATLNIFNHPNFTNEKQQRIRRYLSFITPSSSMKRFFYIGVDGQIIEADDQGFIRNKKDVSRERQDWFFFSDLEAKLRDAYIVCEYEENKPYLTVSIWKNRFNYVSENLVVLERLAHRLDRRELRIQYVTSMDRQGKPFGQVKVFHRDELSNLRTRVVPLF